MRWALSPLAPICISFQENGCQNILLSVIMKPAMPHDITRNDYTLQKFKGEEEARL
jgi:hypothetical protein